MGDQLGEFLLGRDLQAGASVQARRIGTQQIKGQVIGDLVIG